MILGRLEGGGRTRRTLTTDNASKLFIFKPIALSQQVCGLPVLPGEPADKDYPAAVKDQAASELGSFSTRAIGIVSASDGV